MITAGTFAARLAIARQDVAGTYLALDVETPGLHIRDLRAKINAVRHAERLAKGGCFTTADRVLSKAFGALA